MNRASMRLAALSLAFGLMGGGIGFLLIPEHSTQAAGLPPLRVRGRPVNPAQDPRTQALEIARTFLRERVRITADGRTLERTREALGARVDVNLLAHLLAAARVPTSSLVRNHAALGGGVIDLPLPARIEGSVALPILTQFKEEVDHQAVDARVDVEQRRVLPERRGVFVDVYATLARLDEAFSAGRAEVPAVVETTQPALTAAQLADIDMSAVVGWFQTNYNANEDHRDRTYNLHLAASKVNGYVWMPGAVFDFNAVVGDRSEANGFRMATVISGGELIDGVGGGTCQIAGTLHSAAFFAGMEVLDRTPHSRPSGYIKMGLDATVVYPSINLRMRNSLPFPVVIHTRLGAGLARIELLGARADRSVTFVRKILPRVDRFAEREIPDPNLPTGARVITQRGIPGFHLVRYRILREGDTAIRERWTDQYPPTSQIVRVGTGGAAGGPIPAEDDHPEYTADQYLALTQLAGTANIQEVRRPGFCGERGWMVRQGLTRESTPVPLRPAAPAAPVRRPR